MLKAVLTRQSDNKSLATITGPLNSPVLISETYKSTVGVFKSTARTSAGTSIITSPNGDRSIVLTDMIVSTDKVNLATIVVRFTDDTNTVNIYSGIATDAPINFAIAFAGKWQGWQGARLEMETTGALKATVVVGYYNVGEDFSLPYDEWNAVR